MKFTIEGREYDVEAGASKATLQTLYVMKTKYGIGVKQLVEMSRKFKTFKNPLDILDDPDAFNAFRAMIWLARVHAGEKLTMDEACDFPLDQLVFTAPDEPEAEADPKAEADSAPADEVPPETETLPTTPTT
jgi:hypothetical protein